MRTDRQGMRPRGWSLLFGAIALLVVLIFGRGAAPAAADDGSILELESLGISARPLGEAGFLIRADALAQASEGADMVPDGAARTAFLVAMTDATTSGDIGMVAERATWVVRYDGFKLPVVGPMRPDGTAADGGFLSRAFVFIDASTGEWLYTRVEQ